MVNRVHLANTTVTNLCSGATAAAAAGGEGGTDWNWISSARSALKFP